MIFAGLPDRFESEGVDRSDMKMPEGHLRLIQAVSKANRALEGKRIMKIRNFG